MLGVFYFYFFRVALLPYSPWGGEDAVLPSSHLLSAGGPSWLWTGPRGTQGPHHCGSSTLSCFGFVKIKIETGDSLGLPRPPRSSKCRAAESRAELGGYLHWVHEGTPRPTRGLGAAASRCPVPAGLEKPRCYLNLM